MEEKYDVRKITVKADVTMLVKTKADVQFTKDSAAEVVLLVEQELNSDENAAVRIHVEDGKPYVQASCRFHFKDPKLHW